MLARQIQKGTDLYGPPRVHVVSVVRTWEIPGRKDREVHVSVRFKDGGQVTWVFDEMAEV